jgi:RNA polymerase sigma-70 factor (ECF subfamily)
MSRFRGAIRQLGVTSDEGDRLTRQFEASRARLRAVAYRMLGSRDEADDAVQETWLRVDRADATEVENLGGWLTTIVARVCLDRLRSRASRREELNGLDAATVEVDDRPGPEEQAVLADSVAAAMVVVLDLLSPSERVAFVLHDVFAVPFTEVGPIVGRTPEAARQLASRARRRVQGASAEADIDLVRRREVVAAFLAAAQQGDFQALLELLDPQVTLRPDAESARLGALRETHGASAVASAVSSGLRGAKLALVAGVAGVAWLPNGRLRGAVEVTVADGRIVELGFIADPDRLRELDIVVLDD